MLGALAALVAALGAYVVLRRLGEPIATRPRQVGGPVYHQFG